MQASKSATVFIWLSLLAGISPFCLYGMYMGILCNWTVCVLLGPVTDSARKMCFSQKWCLIFLSENSSGSWSVLELFRFVITALH